MSEVIYPIGNLKNDLFWSELGAELKSKIYSFKKDSDADNLIVYTHEELNEDLKSELDRVINEHNPASFSQYRIIGLINPEFESRQLENIDFSRHLKRDIFLNKKITMGDNGRPIKSDYYHGPDLVASIEFDFEFNSNNLITKRRLYLVYFKENGEKSNRMLIKYKEYDINDMVDGAAMVKERSQARKMIIDSVKAFLSGVLTKALSKTLPEVIEVVAPFWKEYDVDILSYVELGDNSWVSKIKQIDLARTTHKWLRVKISDTSTVADYIIAQLSRG